MKEHIRIVNDNNKTNQNISSSSKFANKKFSITSFNKLSIGKKTIPNMIGAIKLKIVICRDFEIKGK